MTMPKITGGGANSRVVGSYLDRKTEPVNRPISVGAVSRLGNVVSVDTPHKSLYSHTVASTPYGATNNTQNLGPGGCGRVVMRAGSQSKTPAPTPMGKGRSLFR